jgi:Fic family protein
MNSPYDVDSTYQPFAGFDDWTNLRVDEVRWDRYSDQLDKLKEVDPENLKKAFEVARRASAVDTGAIEGLYEVDRGFTFSVAQQVATWEADLASKGDEAVAYIRTQISSYDYVLDFATEKQVIAEVWVRELQARLCADQEHFTVYTDHGIQKRRLEHGKYKAEPNHVKQPDGKVHAYAPVEHTPAEMHRLVDEFRTDQFDSAHPALQAAFAHFAFVAVHPFSDGNGRVARALASVFTYRAASIPLMILSSDRSEYFEVLKEVAPGKVRERGMCHDVMI